MTMGWLDAALLRCERLRGRLGVPVMLATRQSTQPYRCRECCLVSCPARRLCTQSKAKSTNTQTLSKRAPKGIPTGGCCRRLVFKPGPFSHNNNNNNNNNAKAALEATKPSGLPCGSMGAGCTRTRDDLLDRNDDGVDMRDWLMLFGPLFVRFFIPIAKTMMHARSTTTPPITAPMRIESLSDSSDEPRVVVAAVVRLIELTATVVAADLTTTVVATPP